MESIITEKRLNLDFILHIVDLDALIDKCPETFDAVVLFDGKTKSLSKISVHTGIPKGRLMSFGKDLHIKIV